MLRTFAVTHCNSLPECATPPHTPAACIPLLPSPLSPHTCCLTPTPHTHTCCLYPARSSAKAHQPYSRSAGLIGCLPPSYMLLKRVSCAHTYSEVVLLRAG